MIISKKHIFFLSFVAALIMSDAVFSDAPSRFTEVKTETQSKESSKVGDNSNYARNACKCAYAFAREYGRKAGQWLAINAIQHAPKLLESVCQDYLISLCGEHACDIEQMINLEEFLKENWGDRCGG